MSQLDLGSIADVSPRHISFLESGRSNPSREMVLHLTEILEVPRQERNRFLLTPPRTSPMPPVIPVEIMVGESKVSLVSTIAQFGSAEDIALADQRIELFFPADEATKVLFTSIDLG